MSTVGKIRIGRSADLLVVAQSRPVISWQILGGGNDLRQDAYEIEVATDAAFSMSVVTSGQIKSSSVTQASWPNSALKSREMRYVRVKAQINGTWSAWSAPVTAEAPLFANKEWTSKPIALPNDPGRSSKAPSAIFRKEIDLKSTGVRTRLYVTAQGLFDIQINGKAVSDELLNPAWTSYKQRIAFRTFDVSSLLTKGKNVISMVIADGWYRGQLTWEQYRNVFGEIAAAQCQLEIHESDGSITKFGTDESWKVSTGEIQNADIYDGVTIDFNKEQKGWREVGFDDSKWGKVEVCPVIRAKLVPMTSPPVRVTESIKAISETKTSRGSVIYDFGQNMAGLVRIKVKGKAGDKVTITHAEVLIKGELHRALLRTAKAEDNYTLADSNEIEISPLFTFHGFRYAEIVTTAQITSVIADAIHSDVARIGHFETSNPALNKLHSNTMWSQRGNFVSVPTDCPQRDERLGWTGDAQAFAPTAATIHDCENFLSSWLVDLELDQQPDGGVTNFAPDIPVEPGGMHANSVDFYGGRAGWGDAATIVPWALYEAYGDVQTLRDQYNSMVRWVDYLESKCAADGLIPEGEFEFGDWCDPDAPADKPWAAKCNSTYISNSFYSFSSLLLSKAADVLGKSEDAKHYKAIAAQVAKSAWVKWSKEVSETATGCAIAIELEIAPLAERTAVASKLAKLVDKVNGKISTGFLGTPLVMPALSKYGHLDSAYKLLLNEEVPGWLYQINNGATSMWERWDAILPDGSFQSGDLENAGNSMISFNHYAYGAVTTWMYRNVAGISPMIEKPGYEEILFAPTPHASLTWAKASVETRYGTAAIDWKKDGSSYSGTITVPAGSIGWFETKGKRTRFGSGTHSISF